MKLNKKCLLQEYQLYKAKSLKSYEENEIEKSLVFAQYSAFVAWSFPIIYDFVDLELEQVLEKVAIGILGQEKIGKSASDKRRVVFYCGQLIDSGALTEQYLHFFIENNYEILVVVPSVKNIVYAKNTLALIKNTPNVSIYIPKGKILSDKIREIYRQVADFNPGLAFLHFLPNDVVGYCVFSKFNSVKRYYIVHNDHTFWLGKGCSDFFLEFRRFGYLMARDRRQIEQEKLLVLPYYPINDKVSFQGFPFTKTNQVVGLSGGHLYKYLMDPELKYFRAIKELLKRNSNFVFCLCGHGEGVEEIQSVFDEDQIRDRFFYLGRRTDFYSLIGHIDILFESYPLKGGLTVRFAIDQNKPLIGIGNPNDASGCIQDLMNLKGYQEPLDLEGFLKEADLLIKDPKYREEKVKLFNGHSFNKRDFDKKLELILKGDIDEEEEPIDAPLQLDDNTYLESYLQLPYSSSVFSKNKLYFLKNLMSFNERFVHFLNICLNRDYALKFRKLSRLAVIVVFGK